jgi:hypothetical protein
MRFPILPLSLFLPLALAGAASADTSDEAAQDH